MEWVEEWLKNYNYQKKWLPRLYFLMGIFFLILVVLSLYKIDVPNVLKIIILIVFARIIILETKPFRKGRKQVN